MGKFNGKPKPKTGINEMGEVAYTATAKEELVSRVLTTFVTSSYYEKEDDVVRAIKTAAANCDPLFVAKTAIYARQKGNMRSSSHLLASILPNRIAGTEWAKNFYERIVVRPDDISEILSAYYVHNKSLPNAMRKGFKKAFEKFDPYQLDKYKMNNRSISLVDLVNLLHPTPHGKMKKAYEDLVLTKGKNLHTMYESKILEKERSAAGKTKQKDVAEAKAEAISTVLDNPAGMPIMNLLRNLRAILIDAPDKVEEACRQLTVRDKILKSRLLPFRFATAYQEIEKLTYGQCYDKGGSISFESDRKGQVSEVEFVSLKGRILGALETAINISCENIPELEGNVAILIDHSGSVRGDGGGHSRVSPFSETTTAMIGNLFGCMMAYKQKDTYIGLFGDKLIATPINRDEGVLGNAASTFREGAKCGGATENGLYEFLETCIKERKKIDNLIIFSDMVIGSGGYGPWDMSSRYKRSFKDVFDDFRKLNPQCHTACVNIRATSGKSVFHRSMNVTEISGWSTSVFDIIASNAKGYKAIIEEIEAIQL